MAESHTESGLRRKAHGLRYRCLDQIGMMMKDQLKNNTSKVSYPCGLLRYQLIVADKEDGHDV